ncbi:hypothetical protein QOT17_015965 [Balamuthia mandrillaris]
MEDTSRHSKRTSRRKTLKVNGTSPASSEGTGMVLRRRKQSPSLSPEAPAISPPMFTSRHNPRAKKRGRKSHSPSSLRGQEASDHGSTPKKLRKRKSSESSDSDSEASDSTTSSYSSFSELEENEAEEDHHTRVHSKTVRSKKHKRNKRKMKKQKKKRSKSDLGIGAAKSVPQEEAGAEALMKLAESMLALEYQRNAANVIVDKSQPASVVNTKRVLDLTENDGSEPLPSNHSSLGHPSVLPLVVQRNLHMQQGSLSPIRSSVAVPFQIPQQKQVAGGPTMITDPRYTKGLSSEQVLSQPSIGLTAPAAVAPTKNTEGLNNNNNNGNNVVPVVVTGPAISDMAALPQAQRTWKRCATHVATAYYIFYQQRHAMLRQLKNTGTTDSQQQALLPFALDPTFEARQLKERSEKHNNKARGSASSDIATPATTQQQQKTQPTLSSQQTQKRTSPSTNNNNKLTSSTTTTPSKGFSGPTQTSQVSALTAGQRAMLPTIQTPLTTTSAMTLQGSSPSQAGSQSAMNPFNAIPKFSIPFSNTQQPTSARTPTTTAMPSLFQHQLQLSFQSQLAALQQTAAQLQPAQMAALAAQLSSAPRVLTPQQLSYLQQMQQQQLQQSVQQQRVQAAGLRTPVLNPAFNPASATTTATAITNSANLPPHLTLNAARSTQTSSLASRQGLPLASPSSSFTFSSVMPPPVTAGATASTVAASTKSPSASKSLPNNANNSTKSKPGQQTLAPNLLQAQIRETLRKKMSSHVKSLSHLPTLLPSTSAPGTTTSASSSTATVTKRNAKPKTSNIKRDRDSPKVTSSPKGSPSSPSTPVLPSPLKRSSGSSPLSSSSSGISDFILGDNSTPSSDTNVVTPIKSSSFIATEDSVVTLRPIFKEETEFAEDRNGQNARVLDSVTHTKVSNQMHDLVKHLQSSSSSGPSFSSFKPSADPTPSQKLSPDTNSLSAISKTKGKPLPSTPISFSPSAPTFPSSLPSLSSLLSSSIKKEASLSDNSRSMSSSEGEKEHSLATEESLPADRKSEAKPQTPTPNDEELDVVS